MKKNEILKIILKIIATAGVVGIAVIAPNALQVLKMFSNNDKKYNRKIYVNKVTENLLKRGLIKFESKNKELVCLTKKGEQELAKYELGDLLIKKSRKWDNKWHVVMFDIKETRKGTRKILRNTLSRLGFVRLQNSVWIFPYNCEDLVLMLKTNLFLGKDVLYMTVDKLENDKWLREIFGLE